MLPRSHIEPLPQPLRFGTFWPTVGPIPAGLSAQPECALSVLTFHRQGQFFTTLSVPPPVLGGGTEIAILEDATGGPGRWLVPGLARQLLIRTRNIETLRRLTYLAERRSSPVDDNPSG